MTYKEFCKKYNLTPEGKRQAAAVLMAFRFLKL
jgi:hypothetical protein